MNIGFGEEVSEEERERVFSVSLLPNPPLFFAGGTPVPCLFPPINLLHV